MRKGMAIAAMLLAGLLWAGCGGDSGPARPSQADAAPGTVDVLARRYAPVVWIHEDEKFGPAPVGEFLFRSELTWRTWQPWKRDPDLARRGEIDVARLGGECAGRGDCYRHGSFLAADFTRPFQPSRFRPPGLGKGEGFYLDAAREALRGEVGRAPLAPIFYEITEGRAIRISYWFFFPFSAPNWTFLNRNAGELASHEGDWENVEVVLRADGSPRGILYYGHGHAEETDWRLICKLVDGEEECGTSDPGRPVVYSALYSHASYATPAARPSEETRVCLNGRKSGLCSHDLRGRGHLWDPLAGKGGLRDATEQAWYGFGGAWGAAGVRIEVTGPVGPSRYKQPAEPEPGELESVAPEPLPAG